MDKFDIKIVPTRWGNTPQNQIDGTTEFGQKIINEEKYTSAVYLSSGYSYYKGCRFGE